ncbi:MAG: hypothetical protein ACI8ZM_003374 [Crocinitomix sp.]
MLNSSVYPVSIIMVDFQKTEVFGVDTELWINHPLLVFEVKKTVVTGQERSKRIAKYRTLDFIISQSGRMFIHGSLHKYYNFMKSIKGINQKTQIEINKGFNGNDFTLFNFIEVLFDIEEQFFCSFGNSRLSNLEVGVNFWHQFITSVILKHLMLFHGKTFKKPLSVSFREVEQAHYFVKVYDKQLQYGLPDRMMRYELKYIKMNDLNKLGIHNLNDLIDQGNLNRIKTLLLKKWDKVSIYDFTIDRSRLSVVNEKRCLLYSNENFWSGLAPNRRNRPKMYYRRIEKEYSEHIHQQISDLIGATWDRLVCNK